MAMRRTKSAFLESVHDTAKGLHGARVMDQVTMREFGRLCLPSVAPLEPEQSKQ
jgi:putative transcriptional regulator